MYLASLPAKITSGEKKGQDATVTISNNKLVEGKATEIIIPQADFQYPQFGPDVRVEREVKDKEGKVTGTVIEERELTEDEARAALDEFVANCGGVVRAAEVVNDVTRTAAVNLGKGRIRNAETGTRDQIVDVGLKASREFTWQAQERVTTAKIRDTLEQIKTVGVDEMPADQLREMLKKLLK